MHAIILGLPAINRLLLNKRSTIVYLLFIKCLEKKGLVGTYFIKQNVATIIVGEILLKDIN